MELLIDKKYLIRLERYTKFGYGGTYDPFAVRYVFALPERAGLPNGYTVFIDAYRVEWEHDEKGLRPFSAKPLYTLELERDNTYRLDRPSDAVYVAKMTENREEGKRYKQYKYTAEEFYALYQNVDLKTAQFAVAKIDIYLEGREGAEHKVLYGNRIESTDYYIGKVQGCWFYCFELDTKRRIGSRGVKILGKIDAANVPTAQQLIKKCQDDLKSCDIEYGNIIGTIRRVKTILSECNNFFEYSPPKSENVIAAMSNIQRNAEQAHKDILGELQKRLTDEDNIRVNLEKQLKKYYIKER